jgi:FSR family fosmidomycin resistance protein-like MFS transporter
MIVTFHIRGFGMSLSYRKPLALLSSGHGCIDLCQGAIPALLPTLMVQRHLTYTAAAGLIFAANITSSIIQPAFGHYADRVRASWLMPLGLLLAGMGLACASIAGSYWLIALCVGLSGIGIATFHPEAARLMNEVAGKQKATGMSIFALGGNIGFALGPLAITALLVLLGLRGVGVLLIPLVLMALILLFATRNSLAHSENKRARNRQAGQKDAWWTFARLTGVILCRSIIFYGLNTFLPLYWISVLHQSPAAGGVALSMLLFVGLVGTFSGGRLADRYGRRRIVLLAFSLLLPCLLLFVLIGPLSPLLAWALLVPIGWGLFAPFSVMVVMGQELLPNHVGTASGVTLGLALTVGGLTAPLLGRVADLYGLSFALVGLAFLPLIAVGGALTLPRTEAEAVRLLAEG